VNLDFLLLKEKKQISFNSSNVLLLLLLLEYKQATFNIFIFIPTSKEHSPKIGSETNMKKKDKKFCACVGYMQKKSEKLTSSS
jgi:hypothetical protein